METITTKSPITDNNIDPDKLLQALYWVWDAFERSNVPYFLVGKTYEQASRNRDLQDSKVDIGVAKNEWISGGRRILDNFLGTPINETDELVEYQFEGVPVFLHVYTNTECIEQLDTIRYKYEEFKTPNPYKEFVQKYG